MAEHPQSTFAIRSRFLARAVGGVLVAWIAMILFVDELQFVVVAPTAKAGFEVFLALLRLFTAVVLFLFPDEVSKPRLRWVALGFLVLGLGGLEFGYLAPVLDSGVGLNQVIYGSLVARTLALTAIVFGLVPAHPPQCSPAVVLGVVGIFALLSAAIIVNGTHLPPFVSGQNFQAVMADNSNVTFELSGWHWGLGLIPLILSLMAVGGVLLRSQTALGWWLVVTIVLLAASQIQAMFWPSAYTPILTTASIMNLGNTIAIGTGAFFALRGVAHERGARLAVEQEYAARLEELNALRADFSAMVAHELGSPTAAIRQAAELLGTAPLDPFQERARALIEKEVAALTSLIADVQALATIESDAFVVQPRPVPLSALLADHVSLARTLPGNHPVSVEIEGNEQVLADPERISQVLRNLLNNAAKYSPMGTPITLRARLLPGHVQIEVIDQGPGIEGSDLEQIFGKFSRGRHARQQGVTGLGLGLYLSRRIVQAHGGELTVNSSPGKGAVFAFSLEVV